jgi:signal transduction histidine kinase
MPANSVGLCPYGLNYYRFDDDLLITGVLVRGYEPATEAYRKMARRLRRDAIDRADLDRVISRCGEATEEVAKEFRARIDALVAEWRENKTYQQEVVDLLRPDLEKTLAQVHDYKQFVQQIVQNIDVALESKFPNMPLEEKLERASHEEAAIYWAAVSMDEKLDAALFLDSPERIKEPREHGRARLHGMVTKYARIYKNQAEQKGVDLVIAGDSWGTIYGNQRALGIIPHTLIDNAVKYAPQGTRVQISFQETSEDILLTVEGFGPEIKPEERHRIFDLFFRGEAAQRQVSEGTGFGLASAQNIARAHEMEIEVAQTSQRGPQQTFLTAFSARFSRARDKKTPARERGERRVREGATAR